ncbi:MAG TPA: hypothetical protein VHC41_09110 [Mycobacteriales bacterium]|jgi:hypothetical protein|nr:hypothetical protein [Mycobacteriales bacterium]
MTGTNETTALTAELSTDDDTFHPRDDDPWWTETVWFAWMVPERNLLGYFYPIFRPNLGVQAGGVLVFDHTGELPWELPVFDYDWHQRIPDGLDLRNASLNNGMTITCREPTRVFELGYDSRDLHLALRAEGVVRPMVTRATPPFNKGHIDQICHVTGEMVLHGETIPVDCFAMRDRSWGPRQDGRQPQVGYSYAAEDPDNAWLAVTVGKGTDYRVTTGFLVRDGVWARLVSGTRAVDRDEAGRPLGYRIEATDEQGRQLTATGSPLSRQVFTAYPSMFCWDALVEWSAPGFRGYGEDQDVWHPRKWRQFIGAGQAL